MKTLDKTNIVIKSFMKKDTLICCVVLFFPQKKKKKKKSKWVVPASCIVSMDKQGLKGTHPFSMDMVKLASTIDTRWSRSFNGDRNLNTCKPYPKTTLWWTGFSWCEIMGPSSTPFNLSRCWPSDLILKQVMIFPSLPLPFKAFKPTN
jgi:hypothetical protein